MPDHNNTKLLSVTLFKRPFPTKLNIGGVDILPSPSVKYLGVTLTAKLTLSEHISLTCKSAKRQVGLIHRMLHQAPPEVRKHHHPTEAGILLSCLGLPVLTVSRSLLAGWLRTTGPQTLLNFRKLSSGSR